MVGDVCLQVLNSDCGLSMQDAQNEILAPVIK